MLARVFGFSRKKISNYATIFQLRNKDRQLPEKPEQRQTVISFEKLQKHKTEGKHYKTPEKLHPSC